MFLVTSREQQGDSNKALNIVFYISAAVLIILLCTVAILYCILRRQQRQYVQNSPHSMVVILRISQEKINRRDNTVASIRVSKYKSFPKESRCPTGTGIRFSHLSLSDLEKASDNDISNRPTVARPVPSYTPAGQSIKSINT